MIEHFQKATEGYSALSPAKAKNKFIHLLMSADKVVIPKTLKKEVEAIVKELWEKKKRQPVARIVYK